MNKSQFSYRIKELPPPQPPSSDSNEKILDLESNDNKEKIDPQLKSKKQNFNRTLSDNHKNYKNLDKNLMPMFSLKSGESNFSHLKWLLNSLAKIQLNMNVCYEIIENMDLDSSFDKELVLNSIIEKYFLIINDFSNEPHLSTSTFKITQSLIYKKMFLKKKKKNIQKKKDFLLYKKKKNDIIIDFETKLTPVPFLIEEDLSQKKCPICYEDASFFKKIPDSNHEFCNNCIKAHLKQNIYNNNSVKIKCPDDCGYILTQKNVEELLSDDITILNKYHKFKRNAELSQDQNVMWCMTRGCENILKSENSTKLIICEKCNLKMCFLCKSLWHEGQSCDEAIEKEYNKYLDHVAVKQCPKCKVRIEKNQGCNHMTCVRCKHQFCWICCKKYSPYHYKWYNIFGCPGLQDTNARIKCVCLSRLKIFIKMFGYILFGFLALALFPIILFFVSIIFPLVYFSNNYKGPCFPLLFCLLFLVCLLCTPIIMIVIFFLATGLWIFNPKIFRLTDEQ